MHTFPGLSVFPLVSARFSQLVAVLEGGGGAGGGWHDGLTHLHPCSVTFPTVFSSAWYPGPHTAADDDVGGVVFVVVGGVVVVVVVVVFEDAEGCEIDLTSGNKAHPRKKCVTRSMAAHPTRAGRRLQLWN